MESDECFCSFQVDLGMDLAFVYEFRDEISSEGSPVYQMDLHTDHELDSVLKARFGAEWP